MVWKVDSFITSPSIYDENSHNERIINVLLTSVANENCIPNSNDNVTIDQAIQSYLDSLVVQARANNSSSIELLLNLAVGKGKISSTVQNILYNLTLDNKTPYGTACTIRSGAQSLIADFLNYVDNNILHANPKLLLIASVPLLGDNAYGDEIPPEVRNKVTVFDAIQIKPQWWVDSKPKNGVFALSHLPSSDDIEKKDYLVQKYLIKDDGACQFRAALALRDKNSKWFNTDKANIRNEINKSGLERTIIDIIQNNLDRVKNLIDVPPGPLEGLFNDNDIANKIYAKTIGNAEFTLYSPQGIATAIDDSVTLNSEENEYLKILADTIGAEVNSIYNMPITSSTSRAYAALELENKHYNIIAPPYFFEQK